MLIKLQQQEQQKRQLLPLRRCPSPSEGGVARVTLGCTIIGDLTRGAIETPRRYDRVSTGLLSLVTCVPMRVSPRILARTYLRTQGDRCRLATIYSLQYFIETRFKWSLGFS